MTADDRSLGPKTASGALVIAAFAYMLPSLSGLGYPFPPLAAASEALRARLGIEDRTSDREGCALTFDDGPHIAGTPATLEALRATGVKATFFLVGEQVRANPAVAREIVAEGHWIGLHCDRHRNLMRLTPWQVRSDIERAQAAIGEATGLAPTLYRPPYGIPNAAALRLARQRGWRTLLWSDWGRDWQARASAESIASLATASMQPGSVLLLHDADHYSAEGSWRKTVAALPRILERLDAAGLTPKAP